MCVPSLFNSPTFELVSIVSMVSTRSGTGRPDRYGRYRRPARRPISDNRRPATCWKRSEAISPPTASFILSFPRLLHLKLCQQ